MLRLFRPRPASTENVLFLLLSRAFLPPDQSGAELRGRIWHVHGPCGAPGRMWCGWCTSARVFPPFTLRQTAERERVIPAIALSKVAACFSYLRFVWTKFCWSLGLWIAFLIYSFLLFGLVGCLRRVHPVGGGQIQVVYHSFLSLVLTTTGRSIEPSQSDARWRIVLVAYLSHRILVHR